jgi:hypothetical protein
MAKKPTAASAPDEGVGSQTRGLAETQGRSTKEIAPVLSPSRMVGFGHCQPGRLRVMRIPG